MRTKCAPRAAPATPPAPARIAGAQILSPIPEAHFAHIGGGGSGTLLWFCVPMVVPAAGELRSMELARAGALGDGADGLDGLGIGPGAGLVPQRPYVVRLSGTLRMLVVEDQRTMRQMVAMLFQVRARGDAARREGRRRTHDE